MWHEARKQERRIRGMIVDYRKRAERRQDFYEKIQADPTQFIQVHGRRCKIHLDPAVAAAGDGAAIIVPWQGQQDNLIDRFDVRAHLDFIAAVPKGGEAEGAELSQEERQCNYERYRILAQNDFLNVPEERFLHQLYLEEQFGANAQLEAERNASKKKHQKSGATIGYSYTDDADSTIGPQPFSHLMHVPTQAGGKPEKGSDSDTDSDIDMDVSIDISKLDTSQAHELNGCGRNYGMYSNDFYSYLTKDADEADALRIAREEEQEKMLLSGRKSRRERRAQKERRIACRPFSPPSYAAKDDAAGKGAKQDEESDSRSPSPTDANTGKITYITSFGGEDELQPHSKISINISRGTHTLGESCADATASASTAAAKQVTYAQKVKENLEKLKVLNEGSRKTKRGRESRTRSHSRGRRVARRSRSRTPTSSRSNSYDRQPSRYHRHKKSRSRDRRRYRYRSTSSNSSSTCTRSSRSDASYSRSHHKKARSSRRKTPTYQRSRSRSASRRRTRSPRSRQASLELVVATGEKKQQASTNVPVTKAAVPVPAAPPMICYPCPLPVRVTSPALQLVELPPPPLKRYYGRKRGDDSDSSSSSSSNNNTEDRDTKKLTKAPLGADDNDSDDEDSNEVDTTSETSNPLPTAATSSFFAGKQTGKPFSTAQAKSCPSYSNASETKGYSGGSSLNLRERLKRKMQSLLNKQYKADKRAEIEKSERERQQQQEREDEMRELALKLRRRQRELRHKYGTPNSKGSSDSDGPSEQVPALKPGKRSKSRSSERSTAAESRAQTSSRAWKHTDERSVYEKKLRGKSGSRERRRSRSHSRSPARQYSQRRSRSRSRLRNRRSVSRRRVRTPSRDQRQRAPGGYEERATRCGVDRAHYEDRYRRSRSRHDRVHTHTEREKRDERNPERGTERDRTRHRDKERDYGINRKSTREKEKSQKDFEGVGEASRTAAIAGGGAAASTSRNRVVISAPPKLKKLVDY